MIVWLASYPRSGNTLLRGIFYQTMGLTSASDEVDEKRFFEGHPELGVKADVAEVADWPTFYAQSSAAQAQVLVKTHRLSVDDQPAIYIVRDGRKAFVSYMHFHRHFSGGDAPSLLSLILGDDFYGDWSAHCRAWMTRPNTLVVRYEALVDAGPDLLQQLAEWVNYRGLIKPWHNRFPELQAVNPKFFRQGQVAWEPAPEWSPFLNAVFFRLHGELMVELGYATPEHVAEACSVVDDEVWTLVDLVRSTLAQTRLLAQANVDKQAVIEELDHACRERLALINALSDQLHRRA